MVSEVGDMKLLGNFSQLIEHLLTEPLYNPSNPALKPPAMQAQLAAALASVRNLSLSLAANKVAINDRQLAFDRLATIIVRSRNILKASGAPRDLLASAEAAVRKVLGRDNVGKAAPGTGTSGAPGTKGKSRSTSQQSYDNQVGNFQHYLSIVAQVAEYAPLEPELKLAALQAFVTELIAKNDAVRSALAAVGLARGTRNGLLYGNDDAVVEIALLAKAYIAGALGTDSRLNKLIKGLKFNRQRK